VKRKNVVYKLHSTKLVRLSLNPYGPYTGRLST